MSVEKKGDIQVLRGYAAKFDTVSGVLLEYSEGIREVIRKGFFRNVLASQKETIHALFNHDPNIILGERNAGTLLTDENNIGLEFEISLSDSQYVRDVVVTPILRGEMRGCSWRGYADTDHIDYNRSTDTFELLAGGCSFLGDIGPVTKPAYEDTEVVARAVSEYMKKKQPEEAPAKHIIHNDSLDLIRLRHERRQV